MIALNDHQLIDVSFNISSWHIVSDVLVSGWKVKSRWKWHSV